MLKYIKRAITYPPFWSWVRHTIWVGAFYLSVALVIFRLVCGGDGSQKALIYKLVFCILLYFLFILEGLLVVGTQLKGADNEAVTSWLANVASKSNVAKSTQVYRYFHESFEDFVAGRQILVMAIIVAMTICVEHLHIENYPPPWFDQTVGGVKWLTFIIAPLHAIFKIPVLSTIASFILITLVPCWLSQLLPQFLADNRSFEFINFFPVTGNSVRLSMLVANMGAGLPGHHAFKIVQDRLKKFTGSEAFGISDKSLFENLATSTGYHVSERVVRISLGATGYSVNDKSIYAFVFGQHEEFFHSIQTPNKGVELGDVQVKIPEGFICSKPVPRALKNYVTSDSHITHPKVITESQIISSQIKFPSPIPIVPGKPDEIIFTASYTVAYDHALGDHEFILDIPKLTKKLRVIIESEAIKHTGIAICKPEVQFFTVNGSFLPEADRSARPDCLKIETKPGNRSHEMTRDYLLLGSLMEIKVECVEAFETHE